MSDQRIGGTEALEPVEGRTFVVPELPFNSTVELC